MSESQVSHLVAELYARAMIDIPKDVEDALRAMHESETSEWSHEVLGGLVDNLQVARERRLVICQDNGVNAHYVRYGTGAVFQGDWREAFAGGVRRATQEVPLRPTAVDPITRENREDNTARGVPLIDVEMISGADWIEITTVPKGFGSENMSQLAMLNPSDGLDGVKQFVLEAVVTAGGRPCPPVVLGVGVGGTFEKVALMAKKAAVLRRIGDRHPEAHIAELEIELLTRVNALGIGPFGLGGDTTAMDVHIEYAGTHIAGNPVAVNFQCWPARAATARIYNDGRIERLIDGEWLKDKWSGKQDSPALAASAIE
ncbi:MAG: fumarate hydratase [Actinobacteria bacterium]|nr:fumarate hydratase [Actinomycetota bacterium]MQB00182.1 fumarate hydratase [Actinomycetota bacterium]